MDSVRVVGLMNAGGRHPPVALRPVCAWARGVGFGYFAGMVSVNKWSIYFHTPWGVHDHLRSLRTCAFTPLAAIVSQSHQPFKETKIRQPPSQGTPDDASPLVASTHTLLQPQSLGQVH